MGDVAQIRYDADTRKPCKYGRNCYRKNKQHLKEFKHQPFKKLTEPEPAEPASPPKKRLKHENVVSESDEESEPIEKETVAPIKPKESPKRCQVSEKPVEDSNLEEDVEELSQKEYIEKYFRFSMPDDFYKLFEYCQTLKPEDPLNAFDNIGLVLVGPFEVLAGKFDGVKRKPEEYLRHWRFYYDPPEVQTILATYDSDGLHYGYYRDNPTELPKFVCSGTTKDGTLKPISSNIFGTVNAHISLVASKLSIFASTELKLFKKKFIQDVTELKISIAPQSSNELIRSNRKVVVKVFHGIDIAVPFDSKTQLGYRKLAESDKVIKNILKNIVEATSDGERSDFFTKLQPVIQWANIAADECDFGTTLELGLDLFTFGGDAFHSLILDLLTSTYKLLERDLFAEIIEAHLKDRKMGNNLSIL